MLNDMITKGYKIKDWEDAVKHRNDIDFHEIYLHNGCVNVVIGTVTVLTKRKVRGEFRKHDKKVRWNSLGVCLNANGTHNADLYAFNINLSHD